MKIFLVLLSTSLALAAPKLTLKQRLPYQVGTIFSAGIHYRSVGPNDIAAFNEKSEELWLHYCRASACRPVAADKDTVLIIKGETIYSPSPVTLVALNATNGTSRWEQDIPQWDYSAMAKIESQNNSSVAIVRAAGASAFQIFNAITGKLVEQVPLPKQLGTIPYGKNEYDLKLSDDGYRFFALQGGHVAAISNGKILWHQDLKYKISDNFYSNPKGFFEPSADVIGICFYSVNRWSDSYHVALLNKKTGKVINELEQAGAVAMDETHFFLRHRESVSAYDRKTLALYWSVTSQDVVAAQNLILSGGFLFTAVSSTNDRAFLNALDKQTGMLQAKARIWAPWELLPASNPSSVLVRYTTPSPSEGTPGNSRVDEYKVE